MVHVRNRGHTEVCGCLEMDTRSKTGQWLELSPCSKKVFGWNPGAFLCAVCMSDQLQSNRLTQASSHRETETWILVQLMIII